MAYGGYGQSRPGGRRLSTHGTSGRPNPTRHMVAPPTGAARVHAATERGDGTIRDARLAQLRTGAREGLPEFAPPDRCVNQPFTGVVRRPAEYDRTAPHGREEGQGVLKGKADERPETLHHSSLGSEEVPCRAVGPELRSPGTFRACSCR